MELVSIVITTFKREKELERAIKSLVHQTYKNMEVIVIDDNIDIQISEKVKYLVEKFKLQLNIIYHKNKKNLGGALSRNEGMKLSHGKYIAFFDDDDEYLPKKIEMQVLKFQEKNFENLGIVYCYTEAVNDRGDVIQIYKNNVCGEFVYHSMLNTIAATTQWLCLKEAVDSVGGFRNVPCKQDTTLLIDLALAGYHIDYVPEVLCIYHESNISRISGFGYKRIQGELLLRTFIRNNYRNISNQEIDKIEYNIGFKLYDLYINNYMIKEALAEQRNLLIRKYSLLKKVLVILYLPYKYIKRVLSDCYKKYWLKSN